MEGDVKKANRQSRYDELKRMLDRRRLDIQREVHERIQAVRHDGSADARRVEPDGPEGAMQEDLELNLIQIHSEIGAKITEAIARVDRGEYGTCQECGEDIAPNRLRALPFATRCKECQEAFESTARRARRNQQPTANFSGWAQYLNDDR